MNLAGYWRAVLSAAAALLLGCPGWAQGPGKAEEAKLTKGQQAFAKQVNQAIDKGVKYVRGLQQADGSWPRSVPKQQVGATALAGLALLEGGVPPTDKAIRKAADFVRKRCINETFNYSTSLAIMFLDRLGDPQDVPFIEHLAVRLLSSQCRSVASADPTLQIGGWSYDSPEPTPAEVQRLNACLANRKEAGGEKAPAEGGKKKRRSAKDLPAELQNYIKGPYAGTIRPILRSGPSDNSNTQFALLALWCARRHGVPVEPALALAEQRLRRMQLADGTWTYLFRHPALGKFMPGGKMADDGPSAQMTCCGLIGLGLYYGALEGPASAKKDISRDVAVVRGLKAVTGVVGHPAADPGTVRPLPRGRGKKMYYTLWTLERMCVLFDIKVMGGKDWYNWGAQILLANQGGDGSWQGDYSDGGCDTCFTLLFLKRTNLTHDLTVNRRKNKGSMKLIEAIEAPGGTPP